MTSKIKWDRAPPSFPDRFRSHLTSFPSEYPLTAHSTVLSSADQVCHAYALNITPTSTISEQRPKAPTRNPNAASFGLHFASYSRPHQSWPRHCQIRVRARCSALIKTPVHKLQEFHCQISHTTKSPRVIHQLLHFCTSYGWFPHAKHMQQCCVRITSSTPVKIETKANPPVVLVRIVVRSYLLLRLLGLNLASRANSSPRV